MVELSYIDNIEAEKHVLKQLSQNKNLSEWERNFIQDVKKYSDNGGFLSNRQKQVLSNLWEKY